jgi:hypothetical protein
VLLRGVGKWGVMAYGSGGHDNCGNQIGCLNLNGDRAHYEVWQQPIYSLKPEPGVECYWSPKDAAALPENRRFPYSGFDPKKWDKGFPLAIDGWVYTGPMKYCELADKVPTGQYRYDQHCYIPAEFTGLGTGVWFIPNNYKSAPGFRDGPRVEICDRTDLWPKSGSKKWYAHYQREDTKAWSRLAVPVPETVGPGSFSSQVVGFSTKHKKVIVPYQGVNGDTGVFDVSAGVEKGTWSVKPAQRKGNGTHGLRCGQKSTMSNGHPRNRALFVWYGAGPYGGTPESLCILDLDDPAYPTYAVKLPLKGAGERIGLHYIPSMDKFIAFGIWGNPAQVMCQKITIPDKLDDFGAYKVEDLPLTAAPGVDLVSSYTNSGMVQYVEKLDCIVFLATSKPAKAFFVKQPGKEGATP